MPMIPYSQLPAALKRKIAAVSRSNRHIVRIITEDEARQIRSLEGWMDGWFKDPTGAQVVLSQRTNGQEVIFCIGYLECLSARTASKAGSRQAGSDCLSAERSGNCTEPPTG